MESRDSFLDETVLSDLTHTPLACSTARLDARCQRPHRNGEKCRAAHRLFDGMDDPLSPVLEGSMSDGDTSIVSLPSDSASKRIIIDQTAAELPSLLAASKQRLSGLVSRSLRQRAGNLLPHNNQHPKDAPAVSLEQTKAVQDSKFQASGVSGVDKLLPTFMLPNQDLLAKEPDNTVDNPLMESTPSGVPEGFEKCTNISLDPQMDFDTGQISGLSTSLKGPTCYAQGKSADFFYFEHSQDIMLEGEEFCSSGQAEAMLKQDEEKFGEDTLLRDLSSRTLSESLEKGIGPQDITRPSWMGDGDSRVSIGMYMRGRSAPLVAPALDLEQVPTKESNPKSSKNLSSESLHNLVLDDLGLDRSALAPRPSSKAVSHLTRTAPQDESFTQPLSISTINRIVGQISLSEGTDVASQKLQQAVKLPNTRTKVEQKEDVPLKTHTTSGTAVLDDGVFKRPFPITSSKNQNSYAVNHGGVRHVQKCSASRPLDPSSVKMDSQSAEHPRSPPTDMEKNEAVCKTPARFLDNPKRLAEDLAKGKTVASLVSDGPIADSVSTPVSCGALRTREWVLKSQHATPVKTDPAQQLRRVSVPCQLPEDGTPPSSPCLLGGTQEMLGTAIKSDQVTHNTEGNCGACSIGGSLQTGTLPEQRPATASSTSSSDIGSLCSATQQAWTAPDGGALVQRHKFCAPSCCSGSSGSEIRPFVMVIPGDLGHTKELDLGCVCVGVLKKTALTLINPSQCAMQYALRWSDCTFDGRVVDGPDFVDITFPKVVALDGLQTLEVKGNFVSRKPGSVRATIKVQPVCQSSEPSAILSILLCALVEWPQLHVEVPKEFEGLEYGGPQKTGILTVTNRGSCTVPLKIMIVEGQGAFSLSSKDVETNKTNVQANTFTIFTSVSAGKSVEFNVVCYPQNAKSLCCKAKVQIFLSGTYASTELLESIPMSAAIAPPKLCIEERRSVVTVLDTEEKLVTLKNKGEQDLNVELRCSTSSFAVAPKLVHIESLSSALVTLVLVDAPASSDAHLKGVLQAVVHPHRIVLNLVKLEGRLQDGNVGASHPSALCVPQPEKKRMSFLESNKQCITWPGVPVGDSVTKSIVFRNPSPIPIKANLMIQECHASCFKVSLKGKNSPSHVASCCLQPRESVEVSVTFCPSSVQFVHSLLVIREKGPEMLNNKRVHLLGFGGKQKVDLLGLSPLSHGGYIMDMDIPTTGKEVKREFSVCNGGDWDCFVCFSVCEDSPALDAQLRKVKICPECLVLKSKESRTVTLSATVIMASQTLPRWDQVVKLGTVKVFHGLEVLRQGVKQAAADRCKTTESVSPFMVQFEGEKDGTDAVVLPLNAPEDIFLKTVSQRVVVLSCGAATVMMQSSTNTSFVPVEDMSRLIEPEEP